MRGRYTKDIFDKLMPAEAACAIALSKNSVVVAITRAAKKGRLSVCVYNLDEADVTALTMHGYKVKQLEHVVHRKIPFKIKWDLREKVPPGKWKRKNAPAPPVN